MSCRVQYPSLESFQTVRSYKKKNLNCFYMSLRIWNRKLSESLESSLSETFNLKNIQNLQKPNYYLYKYLKSLFFNINQKANWNGNVTALRERENKFSERLQNFSNFFYIHLRFSKYSGLSEIFWLRMIFEIIRTILYLIRSMYLEAITIAI